MSRGHKRNLQNLEDNEEEARSSQVMGEPDEPESEMMLVVRALMEEQRRAERVRDENRREEEREKEELRRKREQEFMKRQEELQAESARKLAEQQEATEKRQFEQQVALLRIQQEMGEKATRAQVELRSVDRRRDRALYSIPVLREGDDLEEFLATAERQLRTAGVKEEEWVPIVESRLSGKIGSAWQDITVTVDNYSDARDRLLRMCGYTPRLAADSFYGFRAESSKGLTADQLYHRGQQLFRRMIAPGKVAEEIEFAILRGWVGTIKTKRARAAVDARVVTDAAGLINALQDFLVLEGDSSEGHTATFRKGSGENVKERSVSITCFKCGKVGHKAVDCWKGGASVAKGGATATVGVVHKIICYNCGEEGHKSPQCPKLAKQEKDVVSSP